MIVIDALVTVPAALVAVTVNDPEPVGVPDSTPVVESKLSPAGRTPEPIPNVGAGDPDATNL